jgi:two-component system LytT family response regulator
MSVRVLIVDDERPARAKMARLLATDDRFSVVGEASDGARALSAIEELRPDLVLLDVQMPGVGGFEVLEAIGPSPEFAVVFSTAYDQHAIAAFDAHAVDYLLKPYDAARFRLALDRAFARISAGSTQALGDLVTRGRATRDRIVLRTAQGWIQVRVESITRITAAGKHVWVVHEGGRDQVRCGLKALAERLGSDRFVQVHRSEIVNLDGVLRLEPWTHGDGIIVMRDGSSVVLSRTHRSAFVAAFEG